MVDRILEVGGAGIDGAEAKVKAMMSNMVNSETPGYKKADVVIKSFPAYLDAAQTKSSTQVPRIESMHYDQSPGTLIRTGNSLDVAIGGEGFFAVETPQGIGYTRDGRFILDSEGRLLTVAGNYPVLGKSGQITVTPGSRLEFTGEGKVLADNVEVNSLRLVKFENQSQLEPITGSLFKEKNNMGSQDVDCPRVVSGYVESANVNIIEEMVNLINLSRAYNVDTKIIANRETMLSHALEIGKPTQ